MVVSDATVKDAKPDIKMQELTHPHIRTSDPAKNDDAAVKQVPTDSRFLINAIRSYRMKDVRDSLEHGADPKSEEREGGRTALMVAASVGNLEAARVLLDKGADISARDRFGYDAAHYAQSAGNTDILGLLRDYTGIDARKETLARLTDKIRSINPNYVGSNFTKDIEKFAADIALYFPLLGQNEQDIMIEIATRKQSSVFSFILAEKFPVTSESHQLVLLKLVTAISGTRSKFAERLGKNIGHNYQDMPVETKKVIEGYIAFNRNSGFTKCLVAGRFASYGEY